MKYQSRVYDCELFVFRGVFFLNLIIIFYCLIYNWLPFAETNCELVSLKINKQTCMSCINFSLKNFTCGQKTYPWQFWGMKRSGRCFQRVIYQKSTSKILARMSKDTLPENDLFCSLNDWVRTVNTRLRDFQSDISLCKLFCEKCRGFPYP